VRTFVRRIYEKLQVHTRHAAVAWFHEANGRKQPGQQARVEAVFSAIFCGQFAV
jgi:uncharacterized protein YdeI (YjbR/CyaY-like superfamily)